MYKGETLQQVAKGWYRKRWMLIGWQFDGAACREEFVFSVHNFLRCAHTGRQSVMLESLIRLDHNRDKTAAHAKLRTAQFVLIAPENASDARTRWPIGGKTAYAFELSTSTVLKRRGKSGSIDSLYRKTLSKLVRSQLTTHINARTLIWAAVSTDLVSGLSLNSDINLQVVSVADNIDGSIYVTTADLMQSKNCLSVL